MKIQLDTTNKKIKIEEEINIGELIEQLEKLLPNNLWKEFSLEVNIIHNWSSPIIIEPIKPMPPYPIQPIPYTPYPGFPNYPWITCGTGTANNSLTLNEGVFCIELNNKTIN
jgi:hypothetical protein